MGSINVARKYGISIENQRARQLTPTDSQSFDWILAMDSENLADIKNRSTAGAARIHLLREFDDPAGELDVPDPYYTGDFQSVYEILDRSCQRLLEEMLKIHKPAR